MSGDLSKADQGHVPFGASLSSLQPSQLYISAPKLAGLRAHIDADPPPELPPIPVIRLLGRLVMTDGHTRALALWLRGDQDVLVAWDTDQLDLAAYRECVGWCLAEGISEPAHLASRVVSAEQYRSLWLDRCAAMHRRLDALREGDPC